MSLSAFQLSYQISPIVLVNGIAGPGMLPIISLTSPQAYSAGALSSSTPQDIEGYFAQFNIVPGGSLMDNEVATYPFANQTVAANAIITNPLRISLDMVTSAYGEVTLANKLSRISALKASLDKHTSLGGWYNVATPSYIYQGCLLTGLKDISEGGEGEQPQLRWRWDFMQPLITAAAAQAAQNPSMGKIADQTANTGDPPGSQTISTGVGIPSANIVQNLIPALTNVLAGNIAPAGLLSTVSTLNTLVQSGGNVGGLLSEVSSLTGIPTNPAAILSQVTNQIANTVGVGSQLATIQGLISSGGSTSGLVSAVTNIIGQQGGAPAGALTLATNMESILAQLNRGH